MCRNAGRAKDVLILEKAPIAGGHTAISSGTVSAAWEKMQAPRGIIDSPELMAKHILRVGCINNQKLVQTLAENSGNALEWMESLGVRWRPEVKEIYAGKHLRGFRTFNPRSGYDFVLHPLKNFLNMGGQILYNCKVTGIAANTSSFLVTVEESGRTKELEANAVIVASGGFTENPEMREKFAPGLTTGLSPSSRTTDMLYEGCTGEMILKVQALGAKLVDMQHIQCIPFLGARTIPEAGSDIFLNAQGRRFIQEGCPWLDLAEAIRKLPEDFFWVVAGMSGRQTMDVELKLLNNKIQIAESISDIAKIMEVEEKILCKTLDDYNSAVRREVEDPLGIALTAQPIDKPPYFIGKERLCVHVTLGGIAINQKAQVIQEDNLIIPGLYACGECTGGLHGADKMAGTGMTENFVFGRIAGTEAAKYVKGPPT